LQSDTMIPSVRPGTQASVGWVSDLTDVKGLQPRIVGLEDEIMETPVCRMFSSRIRRKQVRFSV